MNVKTANSRRFGGLLRTAGISVEDLRAIVAAADLSDFEEIQELFESAVCRDEFEKVTVFLDAGVKPGSSVMIEAARSGPADTLERLLSAGGDPNAREWHLSPIFEAVKREDAKKVSLLLDAGATPIAAAMTRAATQRDPNILVQLLAAGGDPNGDELSTRPLHVAAFRNFAESVSILLEAGADPNKECEGTFPLHWACLAGGAETVALLLESGADPHAKCVADHSPRDGRFKFYETGDAPIDLIRSYVTDELDALLKAGVDPNHKSDASGLSFLHRAAMGGRGDFIAKLLEAGADPNQPSRNGDMPLHGAAENGRADVLSTLIAAGADPNGRGNNGNSPLHYAARAGCSEVVEALMAAGSDPNGQGNDGNSPVHYAARAGYFEVVKALLAAGADPNHANEEGQTPLHSVCSYGVRDIEMSKLGETARLLLRVGSDPDARDTRGRTPLFNAAAAADEYGRVIQSSIELVENLVEKGADILAKDNDGKTASFYAFHLEVQAHLVTAEAQARQQRLEAKIQEVGELAPSRRQSSDGPCLIVGGDLFNPREVAKAPAPTALQEALLQRMRL